MNFNDVLLAIPNQLAKNFDSFYIVSKENNVFFDAQYTGSKVKTTEPKEYDELRNHVSVDLFERIENNETLKEVDDNKMVIMTSENGYKYILIIDFEQETVEENEGILIIADDSKLITGFFNKVFKDRYTVLIADNGIKAKELIMANKDKKILGAFIDLNMPEMDGFELLEYLDQENLLDTIPVSVISGEDTKEGIEKATNYNIVDMLQKPFTKESIEAIVSKTINLKNGEKDN